MGSEQKGLTQAEVDALLSKSGAADVSPEDTDEATPPTPRGRRASRGDIAILTGQDMSNTESKAQDLSPRMPRSLKATKPPEVSAPPVPQEVDDLLFEAPKSKDTATRQEARLSPTSRLSHSEEKLEALPFEDIKPDDATSPSMKPKILKLTTSSPPKDMPLTLEEADVSLRLPDELNEPKKGIIADIVDHAKHLIPWTEKHQEPTTVEDTTTEELKTEIADVSQRIHKIESICDRLNKPPQEEANAAEALRKIERLQATVEMMVEQGKAKPTVDFNDILKRLETLERIVEPKPVVIDEVRKIKEQLTKLSTRVDAMSTNLQDTPSYGLHKSFTCKYCGSEGHVALVVRCTQCGKERWQGWWPEEQPPKAPPGPKS